jgi:uncharacterized protein (DUF58 family)
VRRAWVVLLLGLGSLAAALVTGRDLYYHLAYLCAGLLLVAGLWAWATLRGLRLTRVTRSLRATVGRPLEEQFRLYNTSWLPKVWLVVRDESDLPDHRAGRVIHSLGPHREHTWIVRTVCQRRGRFRLGPMAVSTGDPFGLFEFERYLGQTTSVVVYPATVPLLGFPRPRGDISGGDALRRRTHYVTTNAAGVRDYAPGDGFNRIHWPSTARHAALIVKEFELDPLRDVWIFLDLERDAHVPEPAREVAATQSPLRPWWTMLADGSLFPSTEEYAIAAAASIAEHFLRRRRAVGLVAYGQRREVIQADRGERQLGKVLELLAVLRAEGRVPFRDVLLTESRALARGVTLVAVSPSPRLEWAEAALLLDRAGLRVVSIVVDGASFGGPPGAALLVQRFGLTGIPALVLRNGDALEAALSALAVQERPTMVHLPEPPEQAVFRHSTWQ